MTFPNIARFYPPASDDNLNTVVLDIGNGMLCYCITNANSGRFAARPWIMVGGSPVHIQLEYPNNKLDFSDMKETVNV